MQSSLKDKQLTIEEYFFIEERSEVRHEFVNGNLYEMSGASREHHKICKKLLFIFEALLGNKGYEIFIENMKVKISNERKYYYPDIVVTKEAQTDENRYVQFEPVLLAEVVSDFSRTRDMVDKLIQYQKFSSLKYYLIIEQEKPEVTIVSRNKEDNWQSETYNSPEERIVLAAIEAEFTVSEIYNIF